MANKNAVTTSSGTITKTPAKATKPVSKKTTPAVAEKPAVVKAAVKKAAGKPSSDAIARAAYLNYRRRVEQGLPGSSHSDWLEAERQLAEHH